MELRPPLNGPKPYGLSAREDRGRGRGGDATARGAGPFIRRRAPRGSSVLHSRAATEAAATAAGRSRSRSRRPYSSARLLFLKDTFFGYYCKTRAQSLPSTPPPLSPHPLSFGTPRLPRPLTRSLCWLFVLLSDERGGAKRRGAWSVAERGGAWRSVAQRGGAWQGRAGVSPLVTEECVLKRSVANLHSSWGIVLEGAWWGVTVRSARA